MPIQSIRSGTLSRSTAVGNAIILPGNFESIATATGTGSSPTITFDNIPQTFTHLQIRGLAKYTPTGNDRSPAWFRFNGDTGTNYSNHNVYGTGSTVAADGPINQSYGRFISVMAPSSYSSYTNIFGVFVADILDYADTNKYKTTRGIGGFEANTSTYSNVCFTSSLWRSTSAITSIVITPDSGNWAQYSHFALYGVN